MGEGEDDGEGENPCKTFVFNALAHPQEPVAPTSSLRPPRGRLRPCAPEGAGFPPAPPKEPASPPRPPRSRLHWGPPRSRLRRGAPQGAGFRRPPRSRLRPSAPEGAASAAQTNDAFVGARTGREGSEDPTTPISGKKSWQRANNSSAACQDFLACCQKCLAASWQAAKPKWFTCQEKLVQMAAVKTAIC